MIQQRPHPAQTAGEFLARGIYPLPVQPNEKRCTESGWPNMRLTVNDLPVKFGDDSNIGIILGSASHDATDIDMDWPECGRLFDLFFPATWTFGRKENGALQVRHVTVRCHGMKNHTFDAPVIIGGSKHKRRIVEILSTGKYVVVPGSYHKETGELITWIKSPEEVPLAEMDPRNLYAATRELAGAALLTWLWPELEGSRNDVLLSLTGALVHAGWDREKILQVLWRIVQVAGDEEPHSRKKVIASTLLRAADGEPITGLPTLSQYLDDAVIHCLTDWWKLGAVGPELEIAGNCQPAQLGSQPWPELLEFEADQELHSTTPYPVDQLGEVMAGAVRALVQIQQVPAALAAQSVLAAATTAIHSRYDVVRSGRRIPLSLWMVLIAKPGERKTTTDDLALEKLRQLRKDAKAAYTIQLATWKSALTDKENTDDPGVRPRNPVWFMQECTTEGLLKSLDLHWPALTLTNSDAAAWVSGYSMRDNRDSATAAIMSSIWSGSPFTSMRASKDEPTELYGRRLALSLMLQPSLAATLFDSKVLAGQGFLSRCLPAFPDSTIGSRLYRNLLDDTRLEAFHARIGEIVAVTVPMDPLTGELRPAELPLTPDSMQRWITVHDLYEKGLASSYRSIEEVANKAAEQVLRLAGTQAVMQGSNEITAGHIDNAAVLMDWYLEQWFTLTARLVSHQHHIAKPKELWDWMVKRREEHEQTIFNLREMCRKGPRLIRGNTQKARDLVHDLVRRGYVRPSGKDYEMRPADEQ